MKSENDKQYVRIKKVSLVIALLVLCAGLFGWRLGRSGSPTTTESINKPQTSTPSNNVAGPDIKSLITYSLPDGWKEASCPNAVGSVFVIPAGTSGADCDANPSSPVKISIDSSNSTDCNDLQNVQNVRKHICVSVYINGKKSLKAETIYNQASSYKKETTINAYYINTGKGVVKVEYVRDANNNEYQAGLDQLAMSVQVK